jgi:MoaA/NifB/PqqE/SkfB family radical SAM enzyme
VCEPDLPADIVLVWVNPLTVNAVVHRQNLDRLPELIDLAVAWGAQRLEVAHVQNHGWALENLAALMPTRGQVERAGTDGARHQCNPLLEVVCDEDSHTLNVMYLATSGRTETGQPNASEGAEEWTRVLALVWQRLDESSAP